MMQKQLSVLVNVLDICILEQKGPPPILEFLAREVRDITTLQHAPSSLASRSDSVQPMGNDHASPAAKEMTTPAMAGDSAAASTVGGDATEASGLPPMAEELPEAALVVGDQGGEVGADVGPKGGGEEERTSGLDRPRLAPRAEAEEAAMADMAVTVTAMAESVSMLYAAKCSYKGGWVAADDKEAGGAETSEAVLPKVVVDGAAAEGEGGAKRGVDQIKDVRASSASSAEPSELEEAEMEVETGAGAGAVVEEEVATGAHSSERSLTWIGCSAMWPTQGGCYSGCGELFRKRWLCVRGNRYDAVPVADHAADDVIH